MANYADELGVPRGPGALNYIDISTGVFNALGIRERALSSRADWRGQKVETSLFSTGLALQGKCWCTSIGSTRSSVSGSSSFLRTARQAGKKHTQVADEIAEMRLREDMPATTRPIEVPDCNHRRRIDRCTPTIGSIRPATATSAWPP